MKVNSKQHKKRAAAAADALFDGTLDQWTYSIAAQCINRRVYQVTNGNDIFAIWAIDPDKDDVYVANTFFMLMTMGSNKLMTSQYTPPVETTEKAIEDSAEEARIAICYAHRRITEILNEDIVDGWIPASTPNKLTEVGSQLAIDTIKAGNDPYIQAC